MTRTCPDCLCRDSSIHPTETFAEICNRCQRCFWEDDLCPEYRCPRCFTTIPSFLRRLDVSTIQCSLCNLYIAESHAKLSQQPPEFLENIKLNYPLHGTKNLTLEISFTEHRRLIALRNAAHNLLAHTDIALYLNNTPEFHELQQTLDDLYSYYGRPQPTKSPIFQSSNTPEDYPAHG